MADSDDDMPPPLEDMSEKLENLKIQKAVHNPNSNSNDVEEIRLAPKKEKQDENISVIKPMADDQPLPAKKQQAKP
jgi:hypothetical protein